MYTTHDEQLYYTYIKHLKCNCIPQAFPVCCLTTIVKWLNNRRTYFGIVSQIHFFQLAM